MRLTKFRSQISQELLTAFENLGIKTVVDLLPLPSFDLFRRLPPNLTTLQELNTCIEIIVEHSSAMHFRGSDLTRKATTDDIPVLLGADAPVLNDLLHGFGHSCLIEITGDRGSGKTALAMNTVMHFLCDQQHRGLWIDTTGAFSVEQMAKLLEACSISDSTIMERLEIALAFNIEQAYDILENWFSSLKSKESHQFVQYYVVIDTITSLLGPVLNPISSQGHAIMIDFMRRLRELSGRCSARVLVINGTAMERNVYELPIPGNRKPALGPSFTYLTDTTLWLSQVKNSVEAPVESEMVQGSTYIANIHKSRTTAAGYYYRFAIERGIVQSSEQI